MSVHKDERGKGTWYVVVREKDWTGKIHQHKKRGFATKREALEYERDLLSNPAGCKGLTVSQLYDLYTKDYEARLRPASCASISATFKLTVLPCFGNVEVEDITPLMLRNWMLDLSKTKSISSVKTYRRHLSAFLNYAVKFYGLKSNPLTKVDSVLKAEPTEHKIYSPADFKKFILGCHASKIALYFKILFYTGIRAGELAGLRFSDLEGNVLHIVRQRLKNGSEAPLKTKYSKRDVSLPKFLADEIRAYKDRIYGATDDSYILQIAMDTLKTHSIRIAKRTGLYTIGLHGFRHSHASLLISKGLPITVVSKRLGHSSPAITLSIYAHVIPKDEDRVVDILNQI